jgi:hypothetical protein
MGVQHFRNSRSARRHHLCHDLQCASRNGTNLLDTGFLGPVVAGDALRDVRPSPARWSVLSTSNQDGIVTFIDTNGLDAKEPRKGWRGRFFHSRKMTFAYYDVKSGAWIREHIRRDTRLAASSYRCFAYENWCKADVSLTGACCERAAPRGYKIFAQYLENASSG